MLGIFYFWRPPAWLRVFLERINRSRALLFDLVFRKDPARIRTITPKARTQLLRHIVQRAIQSQFWNSRLAHVRREADWFAAIPPLSKKEIRLHQLQEFIPNSISTRWGYKLSTSGTTSEPVTFLLDRYGIVLWSIFFRRALDFAGLRNTNRVLIFNFLRHWSRENGIHISVDELSIAHIDFILAHYEAEGIFAAADFLVAAARALDVAGKFFPIRSVLYNGRQLFAGEKKLIQSVFGCELFSLYGATECGPIAMECSAHNGLHINSERIFLEIVDADGALVPFGKYGRILATVFDNEVMPLIRYAVGDIGAIDPAPCACGSTLPRLFLQGREEDVVAVPSLPEGIPFSILGDIISLCQTINSFRVVQNPKGNLDISITPSNAFSDTDEKNLRSQISNALKGTEVQFQLSKNPTTTRAGLLPEQKTIFFHKI